MKNKNDQNRFEKKQWTVWLFIYGFLGCLLVVGGFFGVKAVKDDLARGLRRYIMLGETRVASDKEFYDNASKQYFMVRGDENGFIEPSKIHDNPDYSIMFFGGSTTECMYMDEKVRFPYLFGRLVEQKTGKKINSYNGGKHGNHTIRSILSIFAKGIPVKPKAVFMMHNCNDVTVLTHMQGDYWAFHPSRGIISTPDLRNKYKRFIFEEFKGYTEEAPSTTDEFASTRNIEKRTDSVQFAKEFRRNLEFFVLMCRQYGMTPILLTQFNRFLENPDKDIQLYVDSLDTLGGYKTYRRSYLIFNDTIREVARDMDVPMVDLDRLVPKTAEYMYDLGHLNAKGSQLVANILADWYVENQSLIEQATQKNRTL